MRTFDFEFIVDAPRDVVREFHHDTAVLKILTPPPTIMQVHSSEPLGEGSVSRFTIWAGPVPIRWVATHHNVDEEGFQDVQTSGPMEHWAHTHRFVAEGESRTCVIEHIEYEHPAFPKRLLTYAIFGPLSLWALFQYRKFQTKRHCER
ncbi:MAG: cyclase [Acidimicrobiales bacterium]|nr:cyclase [Acidimicrobiales bacterium]